MILDQYSFSSCTIIRCFKLVLVQNSIIRSIYLSLFNIRLFPAKFILIQSSNQLSSTRIFDIPQQSSFLGPIGQIERSSTFFCSVGEIYSVEKVLKQFLFLSHFFLSDFEFKSEFEHRPKKSQLLFLFSDRGESRTQDSGSRCAST